MADAKPNPGLPLPETLAGNFQDAVRWFNQMWSAGADAAAGRGGAPMPAMLMPTLDIKELDQRIADLRGVEHWLQLNQGLVQTTIQGLEMQRATLAAWQSFGNAAAAGVAAATAAPAGEAAAATAAELPAFQPAAWWAALQAQFAQLASASAMAPAGAASDAAAPAPPGPPPVTEPAASKGAAGKSAGARPKEPQAPR